MVATRGRTFKRPWRRSCLSSKLKSSSAPIGRKDSWCFHAVGSSNAPLLGSTAAEGLPRIGRTSIATRWRSCSLPQSASCSENFVIPPDVFGQTLRYLHEAWDNESAGFTIECRAIDKTTLTIGYTAMDDNYFKAYKRKRLKPKIEIRSIKGRLTVDGELEEDGLFPAFVFSIPQSSSTGVLKILSSSDAVMVFPNRPFKLWQIKRSFEIPKFLSACGSKANRSPH
jgi:hypothetical protein